MSINCQKFATNYTEKGSAIEFGHGSRVKSRFVHLILSVSIACGESSILALARTGESVTVRGVLTRTGKAGNLWILTLDRPYAAHDRSPGIPDKTILRKEITFVGDRQ